MPNIFLLSFSFLFIGLSQLLVAAETLHNDCFFKLEPLNANNNGRMVSMPEAMHKDFILSDVAYQTTIDRLRTKPFDLHKSCIETMKSGFQAMMMCHELLVQFAQTKKTNTLIAYKNSCDDAMNKVIACHHANPLSFLQECTGGGNQTCPLVRGPEQTNCPRASFKNQTLATVQKRDGAINPVFYAAGDCFAEIELLSHLKEQGHSLGVVSLIDPDYKSLFTTKKNAICSEDMDFKAQTQFKKSVFLFMQIIYFLNKLEPGVKIALYLDHESFIENAKHDPNLRSHLVVAIDYQDEPMALNEELEKQLEQIWNSDALAEKGVMARAHSIFNLNTLDYGVRTLIQPKL